MPILQVMVIKYAKDTKNCGASLRTICGGKRTNTIKTWKKLSL